MGSESNDDGGIFDIPEESDISKEASKIKDLAKKYGPSVADMRIALEEKRDEYEKSFKVDLTDEQAENFMRIRREFNDLKDFLSHYDFMTQEQRKEMDNRVQELLEEDKEE